MARRILALSLVVLLAATLVGCGGGSGSETPEETKGPVTIGSKIDTEGKLLGTMIVLMLRDNGFEVVDKTQTGTTDVVRKALLNKEIDLYPEYTGSGFWFFEGSDAEIYRDGERGYEEVKAKDLEANDVAWLTPARANNTWAIVVTEQFAEAEGVRTMSDFAAYVESGKPMKLACSDEFLNNADAMPTFEDVYGFTLGKDQTVILSGGNTAQTEKAVADGTDGVNFGMAYGTDGALADLGLVVLEDDKGAQVVYWPTPIARSETIEQYPEIEDILAPVFESLTLEGLQELNARIQVSGEAAETVAREYLESNGFLD